MDAEQGGRTAKASPDDMHRPLLSSMSADQLDLHLAMLRQWSGEIGELEGRLADLESTSRRLRSALERQIAEAHRAIARRHDASRPAAASPAPEPHPEPPTQLGEPDHRPKPGPDRLLMASLDRRDIHRLLAEVAIHGQQWVEIRQPMTLTILTRALPGGFAVQPDDGSVFCTQVLVYACSREPRRDVASRRGHQLVDLVALVEHSGRLDERLCDALTARLGTLGTVRDHPEMLEHVQARSYWRRHVPVARTAFLRELQRTDLTWRRDLVRDLLAVVSDLPQYTDAAARLASAVRGEDGPPDLPSPPVKPASPRWPIAESGPSSAAPSPTASAAASVPDHHAVPDAPMPTLPAQRVRHIAPSTGLLDPDLIAAKRKETEQVRRTLAALDEDGDRAREDTDSDDTGSDEDLQDRDVHNWTYPEAAPLARAEPLALPPELHQFARHLQQHECHRLTDVRALAETLGLIPLEAVRRLNDWAEALLTARHRDADIPLVEIDEANDHVWVDETLKEIVE